MPKETTAAQWLSRVCLASRAKGNLVYLSVPRSSHVQVLYTAMALLLAAANWCPPLLKQQSLQDFMGNSVSSLCSRAMPYTPLVSSAQAPAP